MTRGLCRRALEYYPTSIPGIGPVGAVMLISGGLNLFMSFLTIAWIKGNEIEAQAEDGRDDAAKSVIFPVFVKVLWWSAFVNAYAGVAQALLPISPEDDNNILVSLNYALVRALKHSIIEGVAFLLMQKGCGQYATRKAGWWTLIWSIITFLLMFFFFLNGNELFAILDEIWSGFIFIFYCAMWMAPRKKLFRRPAAIPYGKFWAIYRLAIIIINLFGFFGNTENVSRCGYIFISQLFLAVAQPLICYWTLLQDSRWWQGLDVYQGRNSNASFEDVRSPLIGSEFSINSAQSLANTVDQMRIQGQVKMLNFARIKLDTRRMLGAGSFSKVYRGTYKGKECAIKLIYTADLTTDVIKRVAAEASILSSIRHPNIVNIMGVSVLPPSVCLILELCSFGSLSDIIRGYGFDWNTSHRNPLAISKIDALYLALGCARGLTAVHAYDATICHRDVKSFNFLVDHQFGAKIADLEMGVAAKSLNSDNRDSEEADDGTYIGRPSSTFETTMVDDLLANWMAPEVVHTKKFVQASDIFALGTVVWEIISGNLPYEHDSQQTIRQKIKSGYRHEIPKAYQGTPLANLIERCWNEDPAQRPRGEEIVARMEIMLDHACYGRIKDIEAAPQTTSLLDFYDSNYTHRRKSRNSNPSIDDAGESYSPTPSIWQRLTGGQSLYSRLSTGGAARHSDYDEGGSSISVSPPNALPARMEQLKAPVANEDDRHSSVGGSHQSAQAIADIENNRARSASDIRPRGSEFRNSEVLLRQTSYQVPLHIQLPRSVLDTIGIVKEERFWEALNDGGEAWAVLTLDSPHIVMHATKHWYKLFDLYSPSGSHVHLESLMSLINRYIKANEEHQRAVQAASGLGSSVPLPFGSSNIYANSASNMKDNMLSVNEILAGLSEWKQVHGVLSFHLPPNQEHGRAVGYNMMCSVHAYPIYAKNKHPISADIAIDRSSDVTIRDNSSMSLSKSWRDSGFFSKSFTASSNLAKSLPANKPPSSPLPFESADDLLRGSEPSSTTTADSGSKASAAEKMPPRVKTKLPQIPIYYAMVFHELKEIQPPAALPRTQSRVNLYSSTGGSDRGGSGSFSASDSGKSFAKLIPELTTSFGQFFSHRESPSASPSKRRSNQQQQQQDDGK